MRAADEARWLVTINVIAYVREAAASPAMRALAAPIAAGLIADALGKHQERKREIRPSDFGSCTLALWAAMNGLEDIPRDGIDDHLARMDLGTMIGAWEAALLKVAAERDGWFVRLEHIPEGGGHIDALCEPAVGGSRDPHGPSHVVEFKSSYDTGAIPEPKFAGAHSLQSGDYANRTGSPRATLVYLRPPGKKGARMAQFEFDAEPYRALVAIERDRLGRALKDEAPPADPQEGWQCFTCLFSACRKNRNKALDSAELLFS